MHKSKLYCLLFEFQISVGDGKTFFYKWITGGTNLSRGLVLCLFPSFYGSSLDTRFLRCQSFSLCLRNRQADGCKSGGLRRICLYVKNFVEHNISINRFADRLRRPGEGSTPPALSEKAADLLPQAQLVKVPNAGHSLQGRYGDSPTEITSQFLAHPEPPVDRSCTVKMGVRWVLPDENFSPSS